MAAVVRKVVSAKSLQVLLLYSAAVIWHQSEGANGVLRTATKDFCYTYNPNFSGLPDNELSHKLELKNSAPLEACTNITTSTVKNAIALIDRGGCDFVVKAQHADAAGAYGVVVANTEEGSFVPGVTNASDYQTVDIPVGMVSSSDAAEIRYMMEANGGHIEISLFAYTSQKTRFDPANYLMAILAAVIVALGCLWANPTPRRGGAVQRREGVGALYESAYDAELAFDWKTAVGLFVFMSAVLVALFFLYKYLVYLVMAMFVLGSSSAIAQVLHDLTLWLPAGKACYIKFIGETLSVKVVAEACVGLAIGITWVVCRHEDWAWVLQDIMGGCLVAVLLLSLRVPSLKIAFLVLALFWIYDVFMTFITPLFMPHGESIMVSVAVGQKEEMPMVLKLPHLAQPWAETLCGYQSYSLLGFGDLVIPGMFLCFLLRADRAYHPRIPTYFIVGMTSYLLGLGTTYIALYFMDRAQPALLYINPIIAAFALAQAAARRETAALWHGDFARVYAHAQMAQSDVMLTLSDPESVGSDEGD